mmetsp:Transcript_1968/g.4993  ORF Transcript_1968/g.4993 Transcript_1968/m.4993 type:complete len:91 (-) Transcript_1968:695-967(-)|eukprot:CAMPEP_0202357628 /NCGR_PEP_ID=MMETSP1126-20121109/11580_1 /ASSEMBLY_ACC=CAM_ASM_000457 /TAXON_ID=3047 /ORGANISM="Dunaliella tertiolecta, Strain CCMP1320" /LENGTH=90 /DNA_ID=CAMNT_0048950549 /DNA_START=122 /DNA_END=394 /DNA_ORIENTATION=-
MSAPIKDTPRETHQNIEASQAVTPELLLQSPNTITSCTWLPPQSSNLLQHLSEGMHPILRHMILERGDQHSTGSLRLRDLRCKEGNDGSL